MAYREVKHDRNQKKYLLRITSKSSIRNIVDSLGIHRETIKNYVNLQENLIRCV